MILISVKYSISHKQGVA